MSTFRSSVFSCAHLIESTNQSTLAVEVRPSKTQQLRTALPILLIEVLSLLGGMIAIDFIAASYLSDWQSLSSAVTTCLIGGTVLMYAAFGLYPGLGINPVYEFRQCVLGIAVCFCFAWVAAPDAASRISLVVAFPALLLIASLCRPIARHYLSKLNWWGVNCLVFGGDRRIESLFKGHIRDSRNGLRPVGFVQNRVCKNLDHETKAKWLGLHCHTKQLMVEHNASVAILHRKGRSDAELAEFVDRYLDDFVQVLIMADDDRLPSLWATGKHNGVLIDDKLHQPLAQFIKRAMDLIISALGLLMALPLCALIAIATKITSPGPLFFGHERIGKGGRRFKVWKFRSMHVNASELLEKTLRDNPELREEWEADHKLKNDPRVSWIGKFLRKTSLDELPQLWNVLKGEMSLVGPRPIVTDEIEKYQETYRSYLRVIPGVTGYWQISGRNHTTYQRRVELDRFYVKNWSVWFDIYILARTVKTVLLREGAY